MKDQHYNKYIKKNIPVEDK